ncbi:hypothetical protein [Streptomyces sp. x-80]|uniref:hypothetical protein n=1 Tax=Streptomyces sp. x-80 TaxID=2789282 RepID=UPI00397F01F8
MATRKATARRPAKKAAAPAEQTDCTTCQGSGVVLVTVRVGRHRRTVGQQEGFCLDCFGTGIASKS